MERKDVIKLLKDNICKVVFIKADNSERVMLATLKEEYLPIMEEGSSRPTNEAVVVLWDLEADSWRSFRLDRLVAIGPADKEVQEAYGL